MNSVCNMYYPTIRSVEIKAVRRIGSLSQKPKAFKPTSFEVEYYDLWYHKGLFQPSKNAKKFSIILPPPNVTGTLHLGHALTVTLQDTLARWKRMCHNEVVWIPGVDHAGIATQVVVEKHLNQNGISRFDIGRQRFIEEVQKWKHEKSNYINFQLKKLGASVDWGKEFFTMDDMQVKAVTQALLQLHKKDLIYRDEALVNWSPHLRSAVSDIEVNHVEIIGPTALSLPSYSKPVIFGNMIDFAYKVVDSDKEIVVSTTRIETMLGDVAVAVHPNDERYRSFWGCKFLHPFNGTEIPLVLDSRVDPSFGTGAVKITPAHDPLDFQISKSHNLPKRSVMNEEGILENCGHFSGMKRFDVRESICNELANNNLLKQIRPHKMKIPICSRSGDVIEYLMKPQWFLKCKNMAKRAIDVVKEQELIITPENYQSIWFNWLENIQDWCISRQLWWGHQLPFYHCEGSQGSVWVAAESEEEALKKCSSSISGLVTVHRDPDVLDTWFSSGILPFTCFGWPEKTEELRKYYPLSTLVTGNDILFFWVARMVMLGLELTNQLPFKKVFLHGIICDSLGRKMSKSIGNVITPEDIINGISNKEMVTRIDKSLLNIEEIDKAKTSVNSLFPNGIPEHGVDALRLTLLSDNVKSQYINFDVKQCSRSKNFCNKIWQACNFANEWLNKLSLSSELETSRVYENIQTRSLMEKWILARLNSVVLTVNKALENDDFHIATNSLRNFFHLELCDVYIESIKPTLKKGLTTESTNCLQTLFHCLSVTLKCLSPFMPFVTEHLHQTLLIKKEGFLMETSFPTCNESVVDSALIERMSSILSIASEIRRIKHESGLNYKEVTVWITSDPKDLSVFKDVIETIAKCKINFGSPNVESVNLIKESIGGFTAYFQMAINEIKVVESTPINEKRMKLDKKLAKLIEMSSAKDYKQKAPLQVQKNHQEKISRLTEEIEKLASKA